MSNSKSNPGKILGRVYGIYNQRGLSMPLAKEIFKTIRDNNCVLYLKKSVKAKNPKKKSSWVKSYFLGLLTLGAKHGQTVELGILGKNADRCHTRIRQIFLEFVQKDKKQHPILPPSLPHFGPGDGNL